MYRWVTIHFKDGTQAPFHVLEDEKIQDAALEFCEMAGWDTTEITRISVEPVQSPPQGAVYIVDTEGASVD